LSLNLKDLLNTYEEDKDKGIVANWLVVEVEMEDASPEYIVIPKANFEKKFAYYAEAYNDDLSLKSNPKIRISYFDFTDSINNYFIIDDLRMYNNINKQ
jgi:hypothetical protein